MLSENLQWNYVYHTVRKKCTISLPFCLKKPETQYLIQHLRRQVTLEGLKVIQI